MPGQGGQATQPESGSAVAEAITTKGDLAVGVTEAITQALAKLSHDIPPQDIAMVSVSTTLATNAVVEGHGGATGVVLIGFDAAMVERTGIAKAFPEIPIAVIAGGHHHSGDAVCPLDVAALEAARRTLNAQVDAVAVASRVAPRHAAPDPPPIQCPLMIVKGDGSLALAESVATRPIETVLSGPAASLVGAQWLSGLDSFILSDMGGTTTDLGLLIDGRPKIKEEGAEVGGWRTMVRAIDVRTIGLGGDSEITLHGNGRIQVGPQRVAPVSLVAARYPAVLAMLRADLDDVQGGGSMHGKFVLLPFAADSDKEHNGLTARELETLQTITHAPQPLRKLATSLSSQRSIASLQRKGLVQVSSLTPSDVSHVLGLQANWSPEAATMATQLACRLRDMKLPTPERTRSFAQDVWAETVRLTGLAILQTAFGVEMADNPLTHAVCSGKGALGLATVSLKPSIPVVAVGGPVKVYYEEVQRRLGCEVRFPEFCEVANAVGAATGVVAHSVTVEVMGDGTGLFRMHSSASTRQFTDAFEALETAQALAEQLAHDAVVEMGAPHPQVKLSIAKQYMPNARDDTGLLQATIVAEAIGRPNAAA